MNIEQLKYKYDLHHVFSRDEIGFLIGSASSPLEMMKHSLKSNPDMKVATFSWGGNTTLYAHHCCSANPPADNCILLLVEFNMGKHQQVLIRYVKQIDAAILKAIIWT